MRYRAQHFNGWGPLSDIAYIVAAGIPLKPPAPVYVSTTSTHATVLLLQTPDDAGADISSYDLYIDEIQIVPSFELVSSGLIMSRTFEFAPPLTATTSEIADW